MPFPVFPSGVPPHHNLVARVVGVRLANAVFTFVVLADELLLPLLDALPVSLKGHIEEGIASKHQLCRCGASRRVDD